jgi:hypothetical protein
MVTGPQQDHVVEAELETMLNRSTSMRVSVMSVPGLPLSKPWTIC